MDLTTAAGVNPMAPKTGLGKQWSNWKNQKLGVAFDNIKAQELRGVIMKSRNEKGEVDQNKLEANYQKYINGIEEYVKAGKIEQTEFQNIKNNLDKMKDMFASLPNVDSNAFMQAWRLMDTTQTINNIGKQLEGKVSKEYIKDINELNKQTGLLFQKIQTS